MADLIDRQTAIETAIEAADKWDGGYSSEREGIIRKFFDKVPAAQPELKWIPCSERCPKEEQKEYWICTDAGYQCECR